MERHQLEFLFDKYLGRLPNENEYGWHLNKLYSIFEQELENCDEYKNLVDRVIPTNKIAILLSGHIRRNEVTESLSKLKDYNFDVFVHTWDNIGLKGTETNVNDLTDYESIENIVKGIPNVVSCKIENNRTYIESLDDSKTYFNFSSPEVFIKSQLYSINKSFRLLQKHVEESNVNYSMVIRIRFDSSFTMFRVTPVLLSEINNHNIIFAPNSDCGHHHPDSNSTTCLSCDVLYHSHKQKDVHYFDHTNVMCDIFSYGSYNSMRDYCSCYDAYDSINESFVEQNLENIEKYKVNYEKVGNVYKLEMNDVGHVHSLFHINCSYPERILQKHLRNYLIPSSRDIKIKFNR
jgi:hypothetical protein